MKKTNISKFVAVGLCICALTGCGASPDEKPDTSNPIVNSNTNEENANGSSENKGNDILDSANLIGSVLEFTDNGCSVTGTVVVSLLLCMWMRTRQKEVAIFMSLGKTKSEIFLQTLLEAGSVFTLSVLGATAIGKLFSGVLQNVITGSETVTENLKVVLQIQDIGMLFLLGGAVILVALCCSILPILRANPKDILAKMEG